MLGKRDALSIDRQAQEITRRRDIEMETACHGRFVRNQQLGVEMQVGDGTELILPGMQIAGIADALTVIGDMVRDIIVELVPIFSRAELLAEWPKILALEC